jgi:predicted extracellular nuclease
MSKSNINRFFVPAFLVFLLLLSFIPAVTPKADGPITVTEAIANNTGNATVEGYIVAHTTGNNSYDFEAPFSSDFNIALADSPNETDKEKLLPIQLPAKFRAEFGLQSNPSIIGNKIHVTGNLEAYYTVPGLKSPTSIVFAEEHDPTPKAATAASSVSPGPVSAGTAVSLTTETENATIYYTTNGMEPTIDSEVYTTPIIITENTTIKAIVLADGYKNSDIVTLAYYIATSGLQIHDIQGAEHYSPYQDQYVADVEGIVTYIADANNFYMQSLTPDKNPATSEGILVYKRNHAAQVGNTIKASGQVKEWVLEGYAEKLTTDLPVTEINATNITIVNDSQPLPKPIEISPLKGQPTRVIDNDQFSKFDPYQDGIDYYESLEGMLVNIKQPKVIAPQDYGELYVVSKYTLLNTLAKGLRISENDYNPERLIIDTGDSSFVTKTGDSFTGDIHGVVSYGFSNYRILSDKENLPELKNGSLKQEVTKFKQHAKKLTVASYNVENFSPKESDEKTTKLAKAITDNLNQPDIIGLTEIQDNDGSTNSGNTDASASYQTLIDKIEELGGPAYSFTDIAPVNNQDGGAPGANIRVGFLYNPERVSLTPAPKGSANEAVSYEDGKLTANPGRIDPENPAFDSSRKPLAAQFTFNGKDVIVIANHFNSKGGDQPLFGKNQPAILSSEEQRISIANVVNQFVKEIQSENKNANIITLGDLNDFEFTDTLKTLKGRELTNMIDLVPSIDRYTYAYQGNLQVLDHILVSKPLTLRTAVDIVHINAAFMEEHGRASDHDPVLIQTMLK